MSNHPRWLDPAMFRWLFEKRLAKYIGFHSYSINGICLGSCYGRSQKLYVWRWSKKTRMLLTGSAVGLAIVSGWAGTQWVANHGFSGSSVQSHTFTSPVGETLIYVMTSSGGGLTFGVGSVFGVLIGAFLGSLIKGHFRWEACEDPRELKRQVVGATLMGIGAVFALGCTIGQGVSAFSLWTMNAPIVFICIFAGAALGLRQLITGFTPVFSD